MTDLWQYYLLLMVVSIQGLLCLKNNNKVFLFITFFELFVISGFRAWHIGNDTIRYIHVFIANVFSFDLSHSHMEKGYLLLNKTLSFFTDNPQAILVITSFCILSGVFYFINKYSKFIFLSTLLFIILYFSTTLNIIRQCMALALILFSLNFVIKRQFIQFLLCCLLAITFHTSSIIAILLYFIYPLNIKMKNIITILVMAIIIFVFIAPFLERIVLLFSKYRVYMGNILLGEGIKIASILKTILNFFIFLFCFISYFFIYSDKKNNEKFIIRPQFLVMMSLIALSIQFISIRSILLEKISLYFSIFNIISIPSFINCYSKQNKIILSFLFIAFFILYSTIILIYRPEWNRVLPFEFCFWN